MRDEEIQPQTGLFSVPLINVTGSGGFGSARRGDFIQHNYHWRDVLTHIRGTHEYKAHFEDGAGSATTWKTQAPRSPPSSSTACSTWPWTTPTPKAA